VTYVLKTTYAGRNISKRISAISSGHKLAIPPTIYQGKPLHRLPYLALNVEVITQVISTKTDTNVMIAVTSSPDRKLKVTFEKET
jgi:hypothetical protein